MTLESIEAITIFIHIFFNLFQIFYGRSTMKCVGNILVIKGDTFLTHGNDRIPGEIDITLIIALTNIYLFSILALIICLR